MSERASEAPSAASLMLVARPMPLPAPVMRMILLDNGLGVAMQEEIDEFLVKRTWNAYHVGVLSWGN